MSNRPDEDEMTLLFYGEHPDAERLRRKIAADPAAARRWEALRHQLAALDRLAPPEPRPGLETRIWARLAPELEGARLHVPVSPWRWRTWALLGACLALAIGSFLVGRAGRPAPGGAEAEAVAALGALPEAARARVLTAALAEHLDASERLLVEVSNRTPSLDEERRWAEALLASNRLYRRAAERAGQRRISALLAELEPLLTGLANGSSESADADFASARERIANQDLLFKVRVTRNKI